MDSSIQIRDECSEWVYKWNGVREVDNPMWTGRFVTDMQLACDRPRALGTGTSRLGGRKKGCTNEQQHRQSKSQMRIRMHYSRKSLLMQTMIACFAVVPHCAGRLVRDEPCESIFQSSAEISGCASSRRLCVCLMRITVQSLASYLIDDRDVVETFAPAAARAWDWHVGHISSERQGVHVRVVS